MGKAIIDLEPYFRRIPLPVAASGFLFSLCLIYTGYSRKTNTIIYDFFLLNGILTLVSLMSKLNSCEKEEKNKLL